MVQYSTMIGKTKYKKSLISKAIIEFGPVLVFVILFELRGFFFATLGMMMAVFISILYLYMTQKVLPLFTVIVSLITLFFAMLTIFFHNPKILMFRDTFYDYFFATAIFVGLYNKKFFLKKLFSHVISLTDEGWKTASYVWGVYFICMGTVNEIIRHYGTKRMWVDFKIFVVLVTISLAILLAMYLKNQRETQDKEIF